MALGCHFFPAPELSNLLNLIFIFQLHGRLPFRLGDFSELDVNERSLSQKSTKEDFLSKAQSSSCLTGLKLAKPCRCFLGIGYQTWA